MQTKINSKTNLYGVIGDPISHSLSPIIHNSFFNKRNMDSIYISLLINSNNLIHELELLRNNFKGFNVTIPHKKRIIPYLDKVHPSALEYGAVNTVKVVDKQLIGYNTDGYGFLKSLDSVNVTLENKKVLLLGSGGAGRMAAFEIVKSGGNLTIASRDLNNASKLRDDILQFYNSNIDIVQMKDINSSFDIIINSTPVGMYPNINESPLDEEFLYEAELIYDMIYNPYETKLLSLGRKANVKIINGLPMLVYQGLKSLEIWTGKSPNSNEEDYIFQEIRNQLKLKKISPTNIILIGFMGSGKTSVGKYLSKLLEMNFIDTDELIAERSGKTINEIFQIHGENYFRELEKKTIQSLKGYENTVISSGGGVVLNPENIKVLEENATIIWLKASSEEIYNRISNDRTRPLLKKDFTVDYLNEILKSRLNLYKTFMDFEIETDGKGINEICEEIISKLIK